VLLASARASCSGTGGGAAPSGAYPRGALLRGALLRGALPSGAVPSDSRSRQPTWDAFPSLGDGNASHVEGEPCPSAPAQASTCARLSLRAPASPLTPPPLQAPLRGDGYRLYRTSQRC